ncbi:glycine zipper family protein [Algoriphagus aestuariicola]|uniref:Glycine zipper family protein n=1 Tax=Algoriphagus aestuariicola TaxID=1852016 RepID=A0ABS3BTY5_9BACT|nr:glycine zipper family protein [Algoriphagus aestuariicola]MBN7802749.1 glycine zipper family protein [Algoriphagus aestuariicola]
MKAITDELFHFNAANLSSYLSKDGKNKLWLDKQKMALESFNHLNGKLIDASNLDFQLLSGSYGKTEIVPQNLSIRASVEIDYGAFNGSQVTLADQYITDLLALDDLSLVGKTTKAFNITVTNSTLSQEEKDELKLLSATILSLKDFLLIDDGQSIIYNGLTNEFGPSDPTIGGRVLGCNINTRDVFRAAVMGVVKGAVVGAYVGATGGTVVIPGIMTVTGAVSGAVVGGAYGFVSNAVQSMAEQMFWTCWS